MTDARFPERWLSDRRIHRLSDSHFRAFVTSLAWSVSNRTDGVIEPEDLRLIPNFAANAVKAFVDAELWLPLDNGWQIAEFMVTQTSSIQLAAAADARARAREKKARQRAAKKPTSDNAVVPGDVPGDVPRDNTGQARTGQARTGRGKAEGPENVSPLPLAAGAEWHGAGPNPYTEYN